MAEQSCEYAAARFNQASFPEQSVSYKYLHFLLHIRTLNWLQEGEDRNRYFFWSIAPLMNWMLYDYALSISDQYKKSFRLYRDIIRNIAPKLLDIENNDLGRRINSSKFIMLDKIKLFLGKYPKLKKFLKGTYQKKSMQDTNIDGLEDIFKYISLSPINNQISINWVKNNKNNLSPNKFFTLVSVLFYIEQLMSHETYRY